MAELQRMRLEPDPKIAGEYFIKIYYEHVDDAVFAKAELDRAQEAISRGNDLQQSNTDSDI